MITHIPALELLHVLTGIYASDHRPEVLRLERLGYGAVLSLRDAGKLMLAGAVGVRDGRLECQVQVGGPNLLQLTGDREEGGRLVFIGTFLDPCRLAFARHGETCVLTAELGHRSYELVRTAAVC